MVVKIQSATLFEWMASNPDQNEVDSAYNALDSAVTLRVHEQLAPLIAKSPHAQSSYAFVRQMQGPALSMMRTGVAINQKVRADETTRYLGIRENAQSLLDQLADAVWGPEHYVVKTKTTEVYTPVGKRGQPLAPRSRVVVVEEQASRPRGLNPGSPKQVLAFFNIALGFPVEYEIRKTERGTERTPSANDKALRKWSQARVRGPGVNPRDRTISAIRLAAPFVSLIQTIRDADKMLGVLRTPLDADGRMRCSFNVVGTETGRWSSSKNVRGAGTNLQNITEEMRRMFCADDGCVLISPDLEQAESRLTGGLVWQLTGDSTYLNACEGNDLHTQVCIMAWPELDWSEDDWEHNRGLAERPYPTLSYTYRDVAKRVGHGSNYEGSAFGIAQAVGLPANIVEEFQRRYFRAFPAIRTYHNWVRQRIKDHQYLDTPPPLSRRRWFFSRPWEDATAREAIAFGPQSSVGELLNLILLRVWKRSLLPVLDPAYLPITPLLQNHDSFIIQTPLTSRLSLTVSAILSEFSNAHVVLTHQGETRNLSIPGELKIGYNWAKVDPKHKLFKDGNEDGLENWGGALTRKRKQGARTLPHEWLDAHPRAY